MRSTPCVLNGTSGPLAASAAPAAKRWVTRVVGVVAAVSPEYGIMLACVVDMAAMLPALFGRKAAAG